VTVWHDNQGKLAHYDRACILYAMMTRGQMLGTWAAMALAGLATLCWITADAQAKASYTCPYSLTQTYSAALRLIRVDNGFAVTERDPDAAYLMFEYESRESGSRVTPGAIEMVPNGEGVMVVVKLPKMPRYHEEVLLDALKRKLQFDYGEPPSKQKPKADERPDGGTDAAPDGSARKGKPHR
jgi:hypothetical protein